MMDDATEPKELIMGELQWDVSVEVFSVEELSLVQEGSWMASESMIAVLVSMVYCVLYGYDWLIPRDADLDSIKQSGGIDESGWKRRTPGSLCSSSQPFRASGDVSPAYQPHRYRSRSSPGWHLVVVQVNKRSVDISAAYSRAPGCAMYLIGLFVLIPPTRLAKPKTTILPFSAGMPMSTERMYETC